VVRQTNSESFAFLPGAQSPLTSLSRSKKGGGTGSA
jgi:hypothetical protein